MIHGLDGSTAFQAYSKNAGDAINSFSRGGLNLALVNAAARERNVTLHFRHPCHDIDFSAPAAEFGTDAGATIRVEADLIVGADGAYSAVRSAMQRADRFEYSQSYLGHGYKELSIPSASIGGAFAMEENALHIWPRGGAMMIALPNTDGSFTNTLFWPFDGEHSFANLESELRAAREQNPVAAPTEEDRERVRAFFADNYPDALPLMPTLVNDFFANPTGSLVTVRCSPWRRGGVVLLGDAAHAIVPFYGQGMNAAFEDVVALSRLLRDHGDLRTALGAYEDDRKPNADAIADMALANFVEMRDKVGSPEFRYRKKIEQTVHEMFEGRVSPQYNLVSFSTVPYTEALRRGAELQMVVEAIASRIPSGHAFDEATWREKVRLQAGPMLGAMEAHAGSEDVGLRMPRDPDLDLYDITPTISPRLRTWPGDTPPTREVLCDLARGDNITLSTLHTTVHLGAHADGPNHYGKGAASIDQMPLSRYLGLARVLDAPVARGSRVRTQDVIGLTGPRTKILLLKTGTFPDPETWTDDFAGLSVELIDELAGRGVTTIGIDTPSVDLFASKDLEAHHAILRHGIAILEGLALKNVPAGQGLLYELIALPLKLEGFDASPVRAVLRPRGSAPIG